MRYVKVLDNIRKDITRDGEANLGEGYEKTDDITKADAILVRATDIHNMDFGPSVRCIARSGAGVNNIPLEECARKGIVVFNAPGANSNAVKELVVGLILATSRKTIDSIEWVRAHADDPDIVKLAERNKKQFVGREAIGRKVGVIGCGAVGSKVANALVDLGCDVYGYDPYISVDHAWALSGSVKRVDTLDDLCENAEYVTLHVPSKEDTRGMLGEHEISLMADGVTLFNYSRADIIDEEVVAKALETGKIGQFVTDFATPGTCKMPHTIITPHLGACTGEAEDNCAAMALGEMKDYLELGTIRNSVNYPDTDLGPCRSGGRFAALHANIPNMIGQITAILAEADENITRMVNEAQGESAYTLVDTDRPLSEETYEKLRQIKGVYRIRVIVPPVA